MRVVSSVHFFSPAEIAQLSSATGTAQSSTFSKRQAQVLGLQQSIGGRIGFPQRTIATAQLLYQRFHLFFSPNDFVPHEVAIACLSVSSKINDTPKKAHEIILNSWALRYPEMVRPLPTTSTAVGAGEVGVKAATSNASSTPSLLGLGVISESDIDPAMLEKERKRIVSIETLLLQSISFDFNMHVIQSFRLAIKIARSWKLGKEFAKLSWQIAADCHRTKAPLCYPSATIALASIHLSALLCEKAQMEQDSRDRALARFHNKSAIGENGPIEETFPKEHDSWEKMYKTTADDVESVVHSVLDLYADSLVVFASASATITPISPATPASPSEPLTSESIDARTSSSSSHRKLPAHIYSPPPFGVLFWLRAIAPLLSTTSSDVTAEITQMKIQLRQAEDLRRHHNHLTPAYERSQRGQMLQRCFDVGGIRGDTSQPAIDEQELLVEWEQRAQDRQYASLQRFLF